MKPTPLYAHHHPPPSKPTVHGTHTTVSTPPSPPSSQTHSSWNPHHCMHTNIMSLLSNPQFMKPTPLYAHHYHTPPYKPTVHGTHTTVSTPPSPPSSQTHGSWNPHHCMHTNIMSLLSNPRFMEPTPLYAHQHHPPPFKPTVHETHTTVRTPPSHPSFQTHSPWNPHHCTHTNITPLLSNPRFMEPTPLYAHQHHTPPFKPTVHGTHTTVRTPTSHPSHQTRCAVA